MNKIIDGKRYNTEAAEELGYFVEGGDGFEQWGEGLFRKRTGEFFIHGWGGPLSPYAVSHGYNDTSGSESVKPVSIAEAKKWAEKYLDGDEYEEIFGDPEDGETCAIYVVVDASVKNKLDAYALDNGKTLSSVVTELINSL